MLFQTESLIGLTWKLENRMFDRLRQIARHKAICPVHSISQEIEESAIRSLLDAIEPGTIEDTETEIDRFYSAYSHI